jgi:hypothetical protein
VRNRFLLAPHRLAAERDFMPAFATLLLSVV